MKSLIWSIVLPSFILPLALSTGTAFAEAQEYLRPYDRHQASADAERAGRAQQLAAIRMQIDLIQQMNWYSGLPASGHGPTYYRDQPYASSYRDPPSLEYIYGTGRSSAFGTYGHRVWPGVPDVFEPWPYVPGDIWGYQWYNPVRQPTGRIEIQTGPRRWESHPIYADEIPHFLGETTPAFDEDATPVKPRGGRQF